MYGNENIITHIYWICYTYMDMKTEKAKLSMYSRRQLVLFISIPYLQSMQVVQQWISVDFHHLVLTLNIIYILHPVLSYNLSNSSYTDDQLSL